MSPIDPVCGNTVVAVGRPTVECEGRLFVFCCEECRRHFVAEPGRWVAGCREVPDEVLRETEPFAGRWFG